MAKIYAVALDGAAVQIFNGGAFHTLDAEGALVLNLPGALENYIAEGALASRGIVEIEEPAAPEGQVVTVRNLVLEAGVPVLEIEFGPLPPPAEVAMHRVQKAMALTPWGDGSDLLTEAFVAIDRLPQPQRTLARIEFEKAPNLVRDGATTAAVMALLVPPMTEAERDELLVFANGLP